MFLNRIPDDFKIDREVLVRQAVAHAANLVPRDCRELRFLLIGYMDRCLAKHQQRMSHGNLSLTV